ncbi:TLP20 family protein [Flavobacterium seoulense]|nr:TLP20 family protein [Flavobacterium seoulense]
MIIYILPNVFFNFIIAYASFNELGYTHFFAGTQCLARLTLPMAIFLPVVLTIDIIKRVNKAANQEAIEFIVDNQLNLKKLMTKLSILYGLLTGLLVLSCLLFAESVWSKYYKLDANAMAILVGLLAGLLSVLFTYLPIKKMKGYSILKQRY